MKINSISSLILILGTIVILSYAFQHVNALSCVPGATIATVDCSVPVGPGNVVSLRDVTDNNNETSNASVSLDKSSYSPGDNGKVTITDFFANLSSSTADSVLVTLNSTSDPIGITIPATETGSNTATYTSAFSITSGPSSGTALHAITGDSVKAEYSPVPSFAPRFQITFNNVGGAGDAIVSDYPMSLNTDVNNGFGPVIEAVNFTLANGAMLDNSGASTEHIVISYANAEYGCTVAPNCNENDLTLWFSPPCCSSGAAPMFFEATPSTGTIDTVAKTITIDTDLTTFDGSQSGSWLIVLTFPGVSPGGGGGGVVSPGLVLDFISSIGGGAGSGGSGGPGTGGSGASSPSMLLTLQSVPFNTLSSLLPSNPSAPIPSSTDSQIPFPFVLDGKGYPLSSNFNNLVTSTEYTNTPISLKLNFVKGIYPIQFVGLFTNIHRDVDTIYNSDTQIEYQVGQPVKVIDPHGYFSKVNVTMNEMSYNDIFNYDIVFAKPMQKSDIIVRSWDSTVRVSDVYLLNAWQVVNPNSNQTNSTLLSSKNLSKNQSTNSIDKNGLKTESDKLMTAIEEWGGYSATSISDEDLLNTVGMEGHHIPPWFMKNTKWLVDGSITQDDFVNALKYMQQMKIVK